MEKLREMEVARQEMKRQAFLSWLTNKYPVSTKVIAGNGLNLMTVYANEWEAWQAAQEWMLQSRWISVENELPKFEQEVLIFSDNQTVIAKYLPSAINEFDIQFDGGFWINDGASIETNVTHWQPLPQPPKQ